MIVIVFRSRMKANLPAGLDELGARMYTLATAMPGFVSYKDYQAGDAEQLTLVEFASLETLEAWRKHPEHLEAQRLGRELYFAEYHIQVCSTERDYQFRC